MTASAPWTAFPSSDDIRSDVNRGAVTRQAAVAGQRGAACRCRDRRRTPSAACASPLRVPCDPVLEHPRQLLGHGGDLLLPGTCPGHGNLLVNVRAPVLSLVPQRHRHQRGPGLLGKRRRAAHDPGGLAEELHLDSAAGQVSFAQQGDQAASPQPLHRIIPPMAAVSRMAAWPRPGALPRERPPSLARCRHRTPARTATRKPGSREAGKPRSIPAPGLIQDDGQRTWKLASLLILERRRTTQQDKPASKPHEDQIEQTQRHGRSLCPTATPHLSRQVTAIGRLLAPHRRIAAAHRPDRLLAPRRKTELAKAFGR